MCGICGIYNFNRDKPVNQDSLEKMCKSLEHRGPDDQGIYLTHNLGLGHRRLSIIDLAGGHQPMANEDSSIYIIHNGEIYNFNELKSDLVAKGHIFRNNSDTEVILHSYEEYGAECVNKFNGMWAFVIWDNREKTLFCSRDRFGIKPFYYFYNDDEFIFSSEIKAFFTLTDVPKRENHQKTYEYLAYGCQDSSSETMFKGIYQLNAAHNLTIKNNRLNKYRYWDLKNAPNTYDLNFKEKELLYRQYRDLLFSSVSQHMQSDVDIWTLLSGGLDSSAITCIQNILKNKGLINQTSIKTISIVYDQEEINEYEYVKEISNTQGIINHRINSAHDEVINSLEKVIYLQDEPFSQMVTFNHYFLMKKIRENNIKVVLSGQGSDECLAGYLPLLSSYYFADLLKSFKLIKLFNEIKYCLNKNNPIFYPLPLLLMQMTKAVAPRDLTALIKAKFIEKSLNLIADDFKGMRKEANPDINNKNNFSILNQNMYRMLIDDNLPRILRMEDRNSMSFSIEERVPFLDHRLVEFAFSLSDEKKIDKGVSKKILRESLKGILPEKIRTRTNKLGFNAPESEWMKSGKLLSYLQDINYKKILIGSVLDRNRFEKEFTGLRSGKISYKLVHWRTVNYIVWRKVYGLT